ncbi:MAG: DUF4388 domain-containing protein [Pyrinomonadaceae bacterium]
MQGTSFVVLTGHLNDYPLSNLIGILRRQRKTGRLLVEYPTAPCSFYFENGELVDAQLNTLVGLQAVYVAMSQPNASFNFNPLIQPPRRSIDDAAQKVLLESLGCWEEKVINIKTATLDDVPLPAEPRPATLAPQKAVRDELPKAKEVLALPPAPSQSTVLKREVFAACAILLSLLTLLAIISLTGWLTKTDADRSPSMMRSSTTAPGENAGPQDARTIEVVVRVENGRVAQAFIAHPQPGMEAYEALALRIARQRRYPPGTATQETVTVEISSPAQQQ